jgi:5'-3' exonuclease
MRCNLTQLVHLCTCCIATTAERAVAVMPPNARRVKLAAHTENALLMRKLVELKSDVPLRDGGLSSVQPYQLHDVEAVLAFFRAHGLQDLEKRTTDMLERP